MTVPYPLSMRPVSVVYADGPNLDSFGRVRSGSPFGIFDNKNIASRNRNQWEEVITGVIITYNTLVGTFQDGEQIRGNLPAGFFAIGAVDTDNGTNSMVIDCNHNDFQIGDTITGQTSGATAVIATTNTGSDIQHDYDRSSVMLTVGTSATDSAIRSTHRYHAYVPAKSQAIIETFVLGAAKTNVTKRVGYFDNLDGLFLEQTEDDAALVIRSSASGTPVDTRITQENWSVDTLLTNNKRNPSKINLDLTKLQIFHIDFQWLGAGRVRFGFNIGGSLIYVHEELHANKDDVVFMKTPTLPIRYEIFNTGVTSSPTTLEEICCSTVSEGGYSLPGLEFSANVGVTPRSVPAASGLIPVFAIRLKNNLPVGEPNRRIAKFLEANFLNNSADILAEIHHLHEAVDITASWDDVGGGSGMEYSTDITAVTGRPAHSIQSIYTGTAAGGKSNPSSISSEFINLHSFISQNHDSTNSELFVIYARSLSGTASVFTSISWIEFE